MSGVLIFGGSGGIGSAIAQTLRDKGTPTFLVGRNAERLADTATLVGAAGYATADATVLSEVESAFSQATASLGTITGVAHCVGSILLKPAHLTSEAEFSGVITQNLTSAFLVVRTAARTLTQGGSILLFSSAATAGTIALASAEVVIINFQQPVT